MFTSVAEIPETDWQFSGPNPIILYDGQGPQGTSVVSPKD